MRTFYLDKGDGEISFGIYAASPVEHSFTAQFSEMEVGVQMEVLVSRRHRFQTDCKQVSCNPKEMKFMMPK